MTCRPLAPMRPATLQLSKGIDLCWGCQISYLVLWQRRSKSNQYKSKSLLQIEGVRVLVRQQVHRLRLQAQDQEQRQHHPMHLGQGHTPLRNSGVVPAQFRSNLLATSKYILNQIVVLGAPSVFARNMTLGCSDVGVLDKMQWLYLKEQSALTRYNTPQGSSSDMVTSSSGFLHVLQDSDNLSRFMTNDPVEAQLCACIFPCNPMEQSYVVVDVHYAQLIAVMLDSVFPS